MWDIIDQNKFYNNKHISKKLLTQTGDSTHLQLLVVGLERKQTGVGY